MLAPIDKLRSGGNKIIQIVVTTSCNLFNCSNCTQLLPFRKDYLHMTLDCFRAACRSLYDWPGVVAMFGGNPCSHPQFPELCNILADEIPEQKNRGLWSNDLLGHGQVVHDTFFPNGTFNLNVHTVAKAANEINEHLPGRLIESSLRNRAWHSAVMVHWKDLGYTYAQWSRMRERCDINHQWSGAIVQRNGFPYGYFCEVAASLDGVRGENNGTPATWGWWKHGMDSEDFSGQVLNCCDKGCGVPLHIKGFQDLENTYNVSSSMVPLVQDPKGRPFVELSDERPERSLKPTDYMRLRS